MMRSFERNGSGDNWKERHSSLPVVVGRKGLGLGRGLVRVNLRGAPIKKEGDDKAPAGIFRLSSAFGYAPARSASGVKLPYLALSKRIEGVDDPRSRYYNRLVDRSKVAKVDWRSSEQMRRNDVRYKWGVVVDHNPTAIPGAGSCIFLHVWESPSSLTAGCTAMRRTRSDRINPLARSRPASDSGSDASPGLPFTPGKVQFAARSPVNRGAIATLLQMMEDSL